MTTNQEGRQAAIRESTSTAYGVAADWHALFDDAGISAGTFNERLLAWINAELSASYSNLVSAMQAYAEDAGYDGWEDMATLVLAMNGAETLLDGETQGLAFDFTDQSALIIDTGTPANNYDSTGIVSNGSLVGPSGKLTYTSPSNKLTMQSDGVMRYQAHNLCLQSEAFNTTWTVSSATISANTVEAPDGALTADALVPNSGSVSPDMYQSITTVNGGEYYWECRLKNGTLGTDWVELTCAGGATTRTWFNLNTGVKGTGNGSITDLGDGWYLCSVPKTAAATSTFFYISARGADNSVAAITGDGSSPAFYGWGAHVYRYPANTDYIRTTTAAKYALPLEYDTSGNCLGLLVEEQRTNLCLQSNAMSNAAWAKIATNDSITGSAAVGSMGLTDMVSLNESTDSNRHMIGAVSPLSTTAAATYTVSCFIRKGARDYVTLGVVSSPTNFYCVTFNATTGAHAQTNVGSLSGTVSNYGFDDLGGGLLRLWVVGAHDGSASYPYIAAATSATPTIGTLGVEVYAGTAAAIGFYSGQMQLEAGSFPTSPIITYGAAATRNADPLSQLTSTFPLSATAGSLYAYVAPYAGADLAGIVSLNDGTGNEEIVIYKDASANIVAQVEDGGVNQLAPLDSTVNASSGTAFKVALAWAANDFALSVDGTAAQTDTGGTLPTVTTLEIGVDQANNYFNGHIKAISYVPRRKTNAELQAETA